MSDSPAAPTMADRLALVPLPDEPDVFASREPCDRGHVFGGLLIGQAARAAQLTAGDRPMHSLHASFLVAGRGGEPLRIQVERTRDGSSFGTRRATVVQSRGPSLVLTADFHDTEDGLEYELPGDPDVPPPDDLPPGRYDNPWFMSRDVPVAEGSMVRRAWFRPHAPVPDDPLLHLQCVAYLSDHGPTRAAREPHAALDTDANRMSVSLDHSVWFHRPVDVNQWLLSELWPVATGRGRGLAMGAIRTADGALVASVAQEVLLRSR
ncbi:MAG: thioesterase family protein [Acidimicrobiales bacterium]|nr:thioesterase family protein [Acidimicrobiales bacterium]MCB9392302.1 thioesterase family protein [Acidimicrobiaceae bacterium]